MARSIYDFSDLSREQIASLIKGNPPRITPEGVIYSGAIRASFVYLAQREKPFTPGQTGKFSLTGLFPHKDIKAIADALEAAARGFYPGFKSLATLIGARAANPPLRDQGQKVHVDDGGENEEKASYSGYVPGLPYFVAKSGQEVAAYDQRGNRITQEEIGNAIRSGFWVNAKLNVYKSSVSANPGVFFGLNGIHLLARDRTFGAGAAASAEDFAGGFTIEDPNGFSDDAAGGKNDDVNTEDLW